MYSEHIYILYISRRTNNIVRVRSDRRHDRYIQTTTQESRWDKQTVQEGEVTEDEGAATIYHRRLVNAGQGTVLERVVERRKSIFARGIFAVTGTTRARDKGLDVMSERKISINRLEIVKKGGGNNVHALENPNLTPDGHRIPRFFGRAKQVMGVAFGADKARDGCGLGGGAKRGGPARPLNIFEGGHVGSIVGSREARDGDTSRAEDNRTRGRCRNTSRNDDRDVDSDRWPRRGDGKRTYMVREERMRAKSNKTVMDDSPYSNPMIARALVMASTSSSSVGSSARGSWGEPSSTGPVRSATCD